MSWTRNGVISELPVMDWSSQQPMAGSQWQQYCATYGLEFAEAGAAVHSAGMMAIDTHQIAVQVFRHPSATGTALLVHGYYDHLGIYGSLIRFCLAQGLNVVAFDLPGHGLSSGERASIGSFQEYDSVFSQVLQKVQEFLPAPVYAFGQSTGGAILMNYLLKRQLTPALSPFREICLMAPLVRPKGWRSGRMVHTIASLFVRRIKRKFNPNSADSEFLRFIAQTDPLQPHYLSVRWVGALKKWIPYIEALPASELVVNIVQGDADQTVDWRYNLGVLQAKFPNLRLKMIAGGQHHLVNESPALQAEIYATMKEWLN
ncbi:alpha/beta hydrolase [Thalassolituus sp. LLYu03]|uniref:alpha/beta hydrolase n=1 Tax=Thalassolituus sp. LLYu03 TaxID=3421656 RepID=UPI003D285B66